MKKVFLMLFLAVCCTTVSVSAQGRRGRAKADYPSKELIAQVKLTDEQVAALKENEEAYQKALKELPTKGIERDSLQTLRRTVQEARLEGIRKALPDVEQYVDYLEYELLHPSFPAFAPMRDQAPRRPARRDFGMDDMPGDGFGGGGMGDF